MDKTAEIESVFNKWRKDQNNPAHFQKLYSHMKPVIENAAMKASYGSNLPQSAHKAYAAQAFLDSLRTYKPGMGAKLETHVYGSVQQKTKRLNYLYQDLGQKPEPRAMKVGLYQNELQNMTQYLGREPSAAELADRLGWNKKDVEMIRKEVVKDLALSDGLEEHAVTEGSTDEEVLNFLYYELNGEQKIVFEYIFGKNGKRRMTKAGGRRVDFDGIAKKVGFSASKVRSIHKKIGDLYKKYAEK